MAAAVLALLIVPVVAGMTAPGNELNLGNVTGKLSSGARTDGVRETQGCATYRHAPPTAVQGTPQVGNGDLVNELNNRLAPYATEHFAEVFAQTEVTDDGRLRVFRKPSVEFDRWILREFAQDCVEIGGARASAKEMTARRERITDDSGYWRSRGIEISTVGGSPIDGVVTVGVQADGVEKARDEIPKRYPDFQVDVTTEE